MRAVLVFLTVVGSGCVLLDDFGDFTAETGGGGGAPAQGGGAAGPGGAGGCAADLQLDADNCGACGWSCEGGECVGGICTAVSVPVTNAGRVGVFGEQALVVSGSAACPLDDTLNASILGFPLTFEQATEPELSSPTHDICGWDWAIGAVRAYHAPQKQPAGVVEACTADGCDRVPLDTTFHVNGLAVVEDELFLGVPGVDEIRSVALDPLGLPGGATVLRATIQGASGIQFVLYDEDEDALWWTTVDPGGCLYRAQRASLEGGAVACFALDLDPPWKIDGLALGPQGGAFAVADDEAAQIGQLWFIDDEGVETLLPTENVIGRVDADDRWVYVGYREARGAAGINVVDPETGEVVAGRYQPISVLDFDASHPDFVFFTGAERLHRWRKPPL